MEELFVRRRYWVVYFLVYVVVTGLLLGLYWGDLARESPLDRVVFVAAMFAVGAGVAAAVGILTELGGVLVLLIPETIRRIKAETRAKALKEAHAEWEAWFARYKEAQASGHEFTEPPPSARNGLET